MKGYLIAGAVLFGLGGCFGAKTVTPEVEFVEVERTKVIHDEAPPPEEVEVVPESCLEAIRLAGKINSKANKMYSQGDEQIDIMSDGRLALISGDAQEFNAVETDQRELQGRNIELLSDLTEIFYDYEIASEDCDAATESD